MDTPSYDHSLDEHLHAIKRYSRSPPIFSRDFAYADNSPVILSEESRMAGANIAEFSATSFAELLSGPTVDIFVGPQRKQWTLHKNLLCHYSSYFESEFESYEVTPDDERSTLELPHDHPRGFELLVKYLYQGRLDSSIADRTDDEKYEHAVSCQKLYTLSMRLHLSYLSDLAIDVYRANLNAAQLVPDAEEINEIYRSSPPHSKMRKLMVRIAARQIMDPGVEKDADAYRDCFEENADFAVEMLNAIREMTGGGMLFEDPTKSGDECQWHEHESESSCSAVDPKQTDVTRRPAKIASPGERRKQAAGLGLTHATPRSSQVTPQQLLAKPDAPSAIEMLQPTTFAPATPQSAGATRPRSSNQSKPRKLERTPGSQRSLTDGTVSSTSSVANESRKMAPISKPQTNGGVNGVQAKPSVIKTGQSKTGTPAKQRLNVNHINGIVRQFDNLNGNVSESGTSASTPRRQPPKLKRTT